MRKPFILSAAVMLAAAPAAATNPEKVIPEDAQPWRPGINATVDPSASAVQKESSQTQEQQANAPGTSDVLAGDAGFEQRVDYIQAVEQRVAAWEKAVKDLDPDTVTKDRFEKMLTEVKDSAHDLRQAERADWETARERFQEAGMMLREEYAELPQARKSEPLDESG